MDIAAMNTRVTFQKKAIVVDEIGNHTSDWTDAYSCFATVSDTGGGDAETLEAGLTVNHGTINFTVRYCDKTKAVESTEFRILWEGEIYDIISVDHLNLKRRALKFCCVKERKDNG